MSIKLKNSIWIHIPKTAGRWAQRAIPKHVKNTSFIGHPDYDAHCTPKTDKPVIAFIRDPVDLMESLYHHLRGRNKKQPWARTWSNSNNKNKEQVPPAEVQKLCGNDDPAWFFTCIADRSGIVTAYIRHWTDHYADVRYVRMEYLAEDLPRVLEELDEEFDKAGLIEDTKTPFKKETYAKRCPPNLVRKIRENEWEFFGQFYGALPE